jgi:hypothetical protein
MRLQRPCSPSDTERAAIGEFNRLNPESLRLAREFAEQRGLIKKPEQPSPETIQAAAEALNRPREVDGRLIRQDGTPILEPVSEVAQHPDAPVGPEFPRLAPLAPKRQEYKVEPLPWREE